MMLLVAKPKLEMAEDGTTCPGTVPLDDVGGQKLEM